MQQIKITQNFAVPVAQLFADLSDHRTFGQIVGANIKRIRPSQQSNKNGLGSVRRITLLPGLSFEESIIEFQTNQLIAYQVTRGSPIKNHRGELLFSAMGTGSKLVYTIQFEPKLSLPLWGQVLKALIEQPIKKGLENYAKGL